MTWKLVFLSSFLLLSNVVLGTYFTDDERLGTDPSIPVVSIYGYLLAGVFVGFGTKLGNGCTTGHGICGMARLSKRSIVAVCTFMASAFGTATLTAPDNQATSKGTEFLRTDTAPVLFNRWIGFGVSMPFVVATFVAIYFNFFKSKQEDKSGQAQDLEEGAKDVAPSERTIIYVSSEYPSSEELQEQQDQKKDNYGKLIPAFLAGALFAVGLAVSGMVLPSKVFGFVNLYLFAVGTYDPTLITVMAGGCIISMISYQFVNSFSLIPNNRYARECPLVTSKFSVPTNTMIDAHLIIGALCFGIGWGLGGLCPGPAMYLAATGTIPVIICWWPAFLVGSFVAQRIKG